MSSYEEKLKPIRRRIILEFLEQCPWHTSNAEIILSVINGTPDGISAYHADVVGDLRWLEAKGYVRLSGEDVVVAEATSAGLRIALGEDRDDGVARPRPKA